ncbi:MAG: FGGY family carbohydrate kinase [Nocardioidaceae bacterium]
MHLGIDLGTSSLKLLVLRDDGTVALEHEAPLRHDEPAPGWAEADPAAWIGAVGDGLDALLQAVPAPAIRAVGVTGHMHGAVLVDAQGRAVRRAVLWPDARARGLSVGWEQLDPRLRARLGGPFSPGLTGPVLGWLATHEPESLQRAAGVLLAKDLVRHHLAGDPTGRLLTDPSDASGTLLWDVAAGAWSAEAASTTGVPGRLLPTVEPSGRVVTSWRGRDVVTGAGDTPASLLALERGVGGWRPGDLVVNLGTGLQVIAPVSPPPSDDGPLDWHCYADAGGGHYAMVAVLNGGLALTWAHEQLGLDWPTFAALAQHQPPGADGVRFRPFLADERGAMRPRAAVGVGWDGASEATTEQRARAAVEAQAFLVRRAADLLGPSTGRVWLVGGGGREAWVHQLVADVLQRPVTRVEVRSAAALGAALLAAGPDASAPLPRHEVEPRDLPALHEAYAAWRAAYYPATTD